MTDTEQLSNLLKLNDTLLQELNLTAHRTQYERDIFHACELEFINSLKTLKESSIVHNVIISQVLSILHENLQKRFDLIYTMTKPNYQQNKMF